MFTCPFLGSRSDDGVFKKAVQELAQHADVEKLLLLLTNCLQESTADLTTVSVRPLAFLFLVCHRQLQSFSCLSLHSELLPLPYTMFWKNFAI